MRHIFKILIFLAAVNSWAQAEEFTYEEYLGFVKKFHPLVKAANLQISQAEANLLAARGAFDPKIEADYAAKQYGDRSYYSIFNGNFKIPTWYGIEVKAGYENNDGYYLNPQYTVPRDGLLSIGINVSLLQGLLMNQRMADLKSAKKQVALSQAERKLQAVDILYNASISYFNWKKSYEEVLLYESYTANAKTRLEAVKQLIIQGDKSAIDSIEAGIALKNRKLTLQDARFKLLKAKLELSNFLWASNNLPLELGDLLIPESGLFYSAPAALKTNELLTSQFSAESHPKITALKAKLDILNIERKLKSNQLLPKLDVGYSYISQPNMVSDFRLQDYKVGVTASFPLFLRKERAGLRMTKQKIEVQRLGLGLEKTQLRNKVSAQQNEIQTIIKQKELIEGLVKDNQTLLSAEERLFSMGESSLFLINTRENNLVSAKLSRISIDNRFYSAHAELFKTIANPD